jgi:hypothetical protein
MARHGGMMTDCHNYIVACFHFLIAPAIIIPWPCTAPAVIAARSARDRAEHFHIDGHSKKSPAPSYGISNIFDCGNDISIRK